MTNERFDIFKFAVLALLLTATTATAQVQQPSMPALDDPDAFPAVGRVNVAGFKVKGSCSGTLIAPDVVLTAAHCVSSTGFSPRVFVAGWNRGDYIAASKTAREVRHPAYGIGGAHDPRNDIGLLFLDTPITDVVPIPLGTQDGWEVAVLGYHQYRPHMLSGRFDCPSGDYQAHLVQITCPVTAGNSGGPVLEMQDGQWVLVGVISSQRRGGTAVAVPISDWVLREMEQR